MLIKLKRLWSKSNFLIHLSAYFGFEYLQVFDEEVHSRESCISTSPRAFSSGVSVQQFNPIPPSPPEAAIGQPQRIALVAAPQQVPNNAPVGAVRPAISSAGRRPIGPIPQQQLLNSKFSGFRIYLAFPFKTVS
ncbi:hypothetical protein WUBG_04950 [Wuchereria bancrofti]|uniref:Uncharacterized protein n=1 Tax=Wuchereria bancrofti TaxID=6293 RepID=J9ENS0_WUCBA|nr:hypothetical protein WUBG_04950 [Wuchereria bancrofti]VDM13090.1 unnamed protein product [Wuchereria bancrofti]